MQKRKVTQFKKRLEQMANQCGVRLREATESELSVSAAAAATETGARDATAAYLNWRSLTGYLINWALERIDQGTFGECELCKEQIGEQRLRAMPFAPFCLPCQNAVDAGMYPRLKRYRTGSVSCVHTGTRNWGRSSGEE